MQFCGNISHISRDFDFLPVFGRISRFFQSKNKIYPDFTFFRLTGLSVLIAKFFKFQEVKIIGLTITRTNIKQKHVVFACKANFSISSKILFLAIYCFKISLFFIKEVVVLSQIFAHLQETEHPDLEGFFDAEIDHTDNLNNNTWNIPRFSNIDASDFTIHTCSK